jgi:Kef-type K+ transport system membrane component KefB
MIGAFIFLLAIIGLGVFWAFFSFVPEYVNKKQLKAFNWTVVGMCAMFCTGLSLYIWSGLSPEGRDDFFWSLAIGASLAAEIVFFTLGLLLRNFWIFAPPRRGRSIFD